MNIFIIAIVMFFSDPNRPYWLNDSVEIKTYKNQPLYFKSENDCIKYIDDNLEVLKSFGKHTYPSALAVKSIYCVKKLKIKFDNSLYR